MHDNKRDGKFDVKDSRHISSGNDEGTVHTNILESDKNTKSIITKTNTQDHSPT